MQSQEWNVISLWKSSPIELPADMQAEYGSLHNDHRVHSCPALGRGGHRTDLARWPEVYCSADASPTRSTPANRSSPEPVWLQRARSGHAGGAQQRQHFKYSKALCSDGAYEAITGLMGGARYSSRSSTFDRRHDRQSEAVVARCHRELGGYGGRGSYSATLARMEATIWNGVA